MFGRMPSRVLRAGLALWWLATPGRVAAQEHAGQYSQAEIELGSRLYGASCVLCHGTNGDGVANVDLRGGKFRKATSDDELRQVITVGVPGTAMPPHKFQSAELTGVVAYVRSMRDARVTTAPKGNAARGREIFEGRGE